MNDLKIRIEETEDTPLVEANCGSENHISIKGVSMPENTLEFYEPLREQIIQKINFELPTILTVELSYMNSMSNKQIIKLIDLFKQKCRNLKVIWRYERTDDLMKIKGEEIMMVLKDVDLKLDEIN
ncbi:MAG: SiaC family regulatory phosphoprotein [Sphingobacteriaceae bacterium]|jgi:hypothetical protein